MVILENKYSDFFFKWTQCIWYHSHWFRGMAFLKKKEKEMGGAVKKTRSNHVSQAGWSRKDDPEQLTSHVRSKPWFLERLEEKIKDD